VRLLGLLSSLLLACSPAPVADRSPPAAKQPPAESHLRVCFYETPDRLDPALAASSAATTIVGEIFDGLAGWNELGHPVPLLATGWRASDDFRTWTFDLRRDARWTSGRAIVADDIRFHVARILHPATHSVHHENLDGIRGARAHRERLAKDRASLDLASLILPDNVAVRAPDPHTIVVEFERPTPWAAYLFASSYLRPAPREMLVEKRDWGSPGDLITSGPFRVGAIDADQLVLKKWARHRNAAQVRLDSVTLVITDPEELISRYREGVCDVAAFVPAEVASDPEFEHYPQLGMNFYVFNTERVTDRAVRRALAMSIDRTASPVLVDRGLQATTSFTVSWELSRLNEAERSACGSAPRGLAHVSAGATYCYTPPDGLSFDPAAAQRELGRASTKAQRPAAISLNSGILGHQVIAEFVQRSWKERLGLAVALKPEEWKRFLIDVTAGEYEVARMGWLSSIPDPLADFLPPFRCRDPNNKARWCNAEYDRLVAAALDEPVIERRLELARKAERILLEEAVVIPLHIYGQRWLRRPHVKGMHLNMLDRRSFATVWLDAS
jgi:oligopeptide transport system substrate-binding protein